MLIQLLSTILSLYSLYAGEVDHWTHHRKLNDSTEALNLKMNELLENAVNQANEHKSCSEKRLEKSIYMTFHRLGTTPFAKWLKTSDQLDLTHVKLKESIYQDANLRDGIYPSFLGKFLLKELATVMVINGVEIGSDKMTHFLWLGHRYYRSYKKGLEIDEIRAIGEKTENGSLGMRISGVYSPGDLEANYQGLLFYLSIFNPTDANIQDDRGPRVECIEGKWHVTRSINMAEFVSWKWNEKLNCSRFSNPEFEKKITNRIAQQKNGLEQRNCR